MNIYNTLNRKIEVFKSLEEGIVKLYTCGPTVYNYAHIGNLRTYIFEDILKKTLEYNGYKVLHCMNITDVGHLQSDADSGDDKMHLASIRENKSPYEIAEFYEDCFFQDCFKLNIAKPSITARATEHIIEMIDLIKILENKGYTYVSNGNVYFSVDKFLDYGKMSTIDYSSETKSRVGLDENKKNPFDFVLWFTNSKFENHIMEWDSPWGLGYPGWHLECSAMAIKYLGERIDIHCGGIDHISIHHTNEIAQSEAMLGHKWVNYWMHGEFLVENKAKMSKSSGEFLTLEVLNNKGFSSLDYRYFCLNSRYRKQLVYNEENMKTAQNSYKKLLNKILEIIENLINDNILNFDLIEKYKQQFKECLNDDLNTPNALTVLVSVINDDLLNNNEKLILIEDFDKVLSLNLLNYSKEIKDLEISELDIENLIFEREEAKKSKNYQRADEIREYLLSKNIVLKDTRSGTKWSINE